MHVCLPVDCYQHAFQLTGTKQAGGSISRPQACWEDEMAYLTHLLPVKVLMRGSRGALTSSQVSSAAGTRLT